jgi:hypothetical protein
MASDRAAAAAARVAAPKAIGLGAPTSMRIFFERCEIPALIDAIAEVLARHGGAVRVDGRTVEPEDGVDPRGWRVHVGELYRMLGDVEDAAADRAWRYDRFDVLWPTVLALDVVRGAVAHAELRLAAAAADELPTARGALAAAQWTLREFEAVDGGGLLDVWL